MKFLATIAIIIIATTGCRARDSSASGTKTDLGPTGNAAVVAKLTTYRNNPYHCNSAGSGTRVLLSGFSIFDNSPLNSLGKPYNISGTVTGVMSDPGLFPASFSTANIPLTTAVTTANYDEWSRLPNHLGGGFANQRELTIDGQLVTVCFLLLEVKWDQAAAIILHEAQLFSPDKIIMTGLRASDRKIGLFEHGAINNASLSPGYNSSGTPDLDNTPVSTPGAGAPPVLPPTDVGVVDEIDMTWNQASLVTATQPLAEQITSISRPSATPPLFTVNAAANARQNNDYICNNVSFVILHAARGIPVNLVGGLLNIQLTAAVANRIKSAGFFHLPDTSSDQGDVVFGWARVLAKAMLN